MFGAPFGGTIRAGQAGLRLVGVEVDLALKFLRRWREVAAVDRSGGVGRTRHAGGLLGESSIHTREKARDGKRSQVRVFE